LQTYALLSRILQCLFTPKSSLCFTLSAGSLFGVSALTFGKWQLFASLGAVVFRTIGGPTLLSSVLRTPGMPFCHICICGHGYTANPEAASKQETAQCLYTLQLACA